MAPPSSSSSSVSSSTVTKAAIGFAGLTASFLVFSLLRRGKQNFRLPPTNEQVKEITSVETAPNVAVALVPPVVIHRSEVQEELVSSPPVLCSPSPPSVPSHTSTLPVPLNPKPFSYPLQRQFVSNNSNLNLSTFRVISYNILADGVRYGLGDSITYCPIQYRYWHYRWPRIANEILQYSSNHKQNGYSYHHNYNLQGGIVCIQESIPSVYSSTLEPFFSSMNYECFEVKLEQPLDSEGNERQTDAIFINKNVFEVVKISSTPFSDLSDLYFDHLRKKQIIHQTSGLSAVQSPLASPTAVAASIPPLTVDDLSDGYIHDHSVSESHTPVDLELSEGDLKIKEKMSCFADMCTLVHLRYKHQPSSGVNHPASYHSTAFASGKDVILFTTHLHYHPANPEVKAFQCFLGCREMARFARDQLFPGTELDAINWDSVPLVIAGDLNSTPCKLYTDQYDPILPKSGLVSGVYELLTNGRLSARHSHHPSSFIPKVEYINGVRNLTVQVENTLEENGEKKLSRSDSQSSLNSSVSSVASDISDSILPSFILPFRFSSTYGTLYGHEPVFTTKTDKFQGCIDYIFVNSGAIRVRSVLDLPFDEIDRLNENDLENRAKMEAESVYYPGYPHLSRESSKIRNSAGKGTMGSAGEFPPIPSQDYPSDHLMLACELEIIPIKEIIERYEREEQEEVESGRVSVSALSSRRDSIKDLL
jgi:hypothetical protein